MDFLANPIEAWSHGHFLYGNDIAGSQFGSLVPFLCGYLYNESALKYLTVLIS